MLLFEGANVGVTSGVEGRIALCARDDRANGGACVLVYRRRRWRWHIYVLLSRVRDIGYLTTSLLSSHFFLLLPCSCHSNTQKLIPTSLQPSWLNTFSRVTSDWSRNKPTYFSFDQLSSFLSRIYSLSIFFSIFFHPSLGYNGNIMTHSSVLTFFVLE